MKYTNSEGKPTPKPQRGARSAGGQRARRGEGMAREDKKKAPTGPDIFAGADDFKEVSISLRIQSTNRTQFETGMFWHSKPMSPNQQEPELQQELPKHYPELFALYTNPLNPQVSR